MHLFNRDDLRDTYGPSHMDDIDQTYGQLMRSVTLATKVVLGIAAAIVLSAMGAGAYLLYLLTSYLN